MLRETTINITQGANKASSRVIDGFVKGPSRTNVKNPTASNSPKAHATGINYRSGRSKTTAHQLHRQTDKAQTLMRGALKKPGVNLGAKIQRMTPGFNPEREIRARTTAKHRQVERFGNPTANKSVAQGEIIPGRGGHSQAQTIPATTAVALPSMITSASHQKLERMLDEALTKANAHKQALRYQAARHFWQRPGFLGRFAKLKLILTLVVVLSVIGFLAWQKFPVLSVKLAAARAHISASVPAYKPSGYALASPAAAKNGVVLLKYTSAADNNQSFDIAQKSSNMTSVSLAQTIVPAGAQVQTFQVGGNTVYIYGQNNDAAWVNNGVLYTISDHAKLSSDEIIKIVQGLN